MYAISRLSVLTLVSALLILAGCSPDMAGVFEDNAESEGVITPSADASDVLGDAELPKGANAVLSLRVVSQSNSPGNARVSGDVGSNGNVGSNGVQIDTALLILKDIKLKLDGASDEACDDDVDTNGDDDDADTNGEDDVDTNGDDDVDTNGVDLQAKAGRSGDHSRAGGRGMLRSRDDDDDGEEEDEDDDAADDEGNCGGERVHLRGPFLVDLVNVTVEDLKYVTSNGEDTDTNGEDTDTDDDDDIDSNGEDVDSNGSDVTTGGLAAALALGELSAKEAEIVTEQDRDVASEESDDSGRFDDAALDTVPPYVFDALVLPPGVFRKIHLKVAPLKGERFGLEEHVMDGLSVLVRGEIHGIPFEFASRKTENIQFKSKSGLLVEDGSVAKLLLTIDLGEWFDGFDLTDADVADDGTVYINKHSNKALFREIRKRIRERARFGHDSHHGRPARVR